MATRYWVGGGSSANWNATGNTNWGTASGVQDNASVPTSTDDVIFDGAGVGGNTNSTISATITILSLTITTGYTSTMTHNAILSINGNLTLQNTYNIAGTSNIRFGASATITPNGKNLPFSVDFAGTSGTITMQGDWTVDYVNIGNTQIVNGSTYTITCNNGLAVGGQGLTGNITFLIKGGSITRSTGFIGANVNLDGNITLPSTMKFLGTSLKYISGTITGTDLLLEPPSAGMTLDVSAITWSKIDSNSQGASRIYTLISDLTTSGLLTIATNGVTFNTSTGAKINVAGGMTINAALSGTAEISWTGGTWTQGATSYGIANNTTIAGNVTLSGANTTIAGGAWTYSSGTVTTTGSTLWIRANCTLNTDGITWNSIASVGGTTPIVTLTSNLTLNGTIVASTGANFTINRTLAETITCSGGIITNATLSGTAALTWTGGSWTSSVGNLGLALSTTISGNVTISGSVVWQAGTFTYSSGVVTTTGSTLIIRTAGGILNSSGITWNNVTCAVITTSFTLTSNMSINGLITISNTTTINRTTAETITIAGGLTASNTLSGTAKIILTGGTWSGNNGVSNNLDLNGNVTISGTVLWGGSGNTLKYVSGTITTTGSTFRTFSTQNSTIYLDVASVTWNNFNIDGGLTGYIVILVSDLNINGTFRVNNYKSNATSGEINVTTNQKITANGYTSIDYGLTGNAPLYLTGGTATGGFNLNTYFNGNITLTSGNISGGKTLTYLSGQIVQTNDFQFFACTLDTSGMTWGNITQPNSGGFPVITLLSDLNIGGYFNYNNYITDWNAPSGANVYVYQGLLNIGGYNNTYTPTSIYVRGGRITTQTSGGTFAFNLYIDGGVILDNANLITARANQIIAYVSGNVRSINSTLRIGASATIIGFNKIPLKSVTITANQIVTIDNFFVGTEEKICQVSSTGANYTITFQDGFEKIARNVAFSGATLSRPMQMIVASRSKFNTNRGTNVGLRYINNMPDGFAKNVFPIADRTLTGGFGGLQADPNFVTQG